VYDWFLYSSAGIFMKTAIAFLHVILIGGFCYRYWKTEKNLKRIFWPALSVKFFAGISLGLLYTFYYTTGDTFLYFQDGSSLAEVARGNFAAYVNYVVNSTGEFSSGFTREAPRALFLVKIVSVFSLLSFDNYWIIACHFSLFSFLGSWFLVKRIHCYLPELTASAVVAFLFFPSMVFWSSGLIKESLALSSLFFLSGIFLELWFGRNFAIAHWLLVIFASWVLWNLKYYVGAVFFPIVLAALAYRFIHVRFLKQGRLLTKLFYWVLIFIIPISVVSFLKPNFHPQQFLHVIVDNNRAYNNLSAPEDLIHFHNLEPTPASVLVNAPWAFFSGLFRPVIWESGNVLQLLVSLENLLLLALTAMALYNFWDIVRSPYRMLIFCTLVYVGALCIFITLSTPNFGTLARYRVGYLPFFIFLVCSNQHILRILQRSFNRLVRDKT
jgi:hypothetical protein